MNRKALVTPHNVIRLFVLFLTLLGMGLFAPMSTNIPVVTAQAPTPTFTYGKSTLNGHPGYTTGWFQAGALDKPIIMLLGFDPSNDFGISDAAAMYGDLILQMNADGFDVIIFDYVDGDTWLEDNADNLADFITYLDTYFNGDYKLAVVGASMGGIVARTMFAQEYSAMGVDIFITLDSPHYGVYFSDVISGITDVLVDFFLLTPAGQQMYYGSDLYNQFFGWLQSVEDANFRQNIIGPMLTAAWAMSNGEGTWKVSWWDDIWHTKYHPVSSYTYVSGIKSDFIPYHSAVYLDDPSVGSRGYFGGTKYWYRSTQTTYFDYKFPTSRTEHTASNFGPLLQSAMDFIKINW